MQTHFPENLKRIRIENRLSQKQLAEKLDTTIKTVSHWETGYTEPSISQILDLVRCLNVCLDELLT